MIDWGNLVANSLWIIGCSVILASLSYASWAASERKERFFTTLRSPGIRLGYHSGGVLFCAGLAASGRTWWDTLIWVLLSVGILINLKWGK